MAYDEKTNILTVEKKYSSLVREVSIKKDTITVTIGAGDDYDFPFSSARIAANRYKKFLDQYEKIKEGGKSEREKYSLGKYFNFLRGY